MNCVRQERFGGALQGNQRSATETVSTTGVFHPLLKILTCTHPRAKGPLSYLDLSGGGEVPDQHHPLPPHEEAVKYRMLTIPTLIPEQSLLRRRGRLSADESGGEGKG